MVCIAGVFELSTPPSYYFYMDFYYVSTGTSLISNSFGGIFVDFIDIGVLIKL